MGPWAPLGSPGLPRAPQGSPGLPRAQSQFLHHPYLQSAKCKILHICTHASIKFLSSPNFYIIPTCKVQSAKSCTFAHVQVLSSYLAPISTSSLPARCKVQNLAHLHTCKY